MLGLQWLVWTRQIISLCALRIKIKIARQQDFDKIAGFFLARRDTANSAAVRWELLPMERCFFFFLFYVLFIFFYMVFIYFYMFVMYFLRCFLLLLHVFKLQGCPKKKTFGWNLLISQKQLNLWSSNFNPNIYFFF